MHAVTRSVCAQDGTSLHVSGWRPPGGSYAAVGVVHGMYAHGGMFAGLGRSLAADGVAAYALDLRGHGRSPGQRGFARSEASLCRDVRAFFEALAVWEPARPRFLYGHSMGAVLVLDAALAASAPPDGVVVSAPPFEPTAAPPPVRTLCRVLSRLAPWLPLPTGGGAGRGLRDPEVRAAYAADGLRHPWATPGLADAILSCAERVAERAGELDVPLLLLQGEADAVARPEGARAFLDALATPDVRARFYPGQRHELHNDTGREQVAADVAKWLRSTVADGNGTAGRGAAEAGPGAHTAAEP